MEWDVNNEINVENTIWNVEMKLLSIQSCAVQPDYLLNKHFKKSTAPGIRILNPYT